MELVAWFARSRRRLELVEFDELEGPTAAVVERVVDRRTALLCLSHVDYRSGALADMAAIAYTAIVVTSSMRAFGILVGT